MENKSEFYLVKKPLETIKEAALPEVAPGKRIRLVRADSTQAYFIDSSGQGWYFKNSERVWRPLNAKDLHPMATQFTQEYRPENTEFDSVEDAALCAVKISFIDDINLFGPISNDPSLLDSLKKALGIWIERCKEVVACIEKIEQESNPEKKKELLKELETRIKEAKEAEAVD